MIIGSPASAPDIAFEFGKDPAAPRLARLALGALLGGEPQLADDVSLVASEFVSNVILHTRGGGRLMAWNADPVVLEVQDHDPVLSARTRVPDDSGGRGLAIVCGLADQWGTRLDHDGKAMWATFQRHRN